MLGVTDEERAAWLAVRLTPRPLRTFTQPLRLTAPAPASLPRSYVHCTEGAMALSFAPFVERLRGEPGWRTGELATGHDAMVAEPEQVARLIVAVADEVDETDAEVDVTDAEAAEADTGVGA
jgi:hypothetical protein